MEARGTRAVPPASTTAGDAALAGQGAALASPGTRRIRRCFEVEGLVQGVGFRPYVYVTACALGLSGSVSITSSGVVVEGRG